MTLQCAIENVNAASKPAFIPYIMAGDGGLSNLPLILSRLQKFGATAIEVGIPFTDPVADGPVIEQAGMRALQNGATLKTIIQTLRENRNSYDVPLIFMSYLNPILAYGVERFAKDAAEVGVHGVIVPDMPLEESGVLHPALRAQKIALVQLISLTSPPERIEKLARASEGFIYAVTVNGTTGERAQFAGNLPTHFEKIKQVSKVPILAGFGISTAAHIEQFASICNGVIIGSKIVQAIHEDKWDEIEALTEPVRVGAIL